MKILKRSLPILALVAAAFYLMSGLPSGRLLQTSVRADVGPAKGSKLSADLKRKVLTGSNQIIKGSPIPVIVQTVGFPSNALLSAIGVSKGAVHRVYRNINALHAHLPPEAVVSLVPRTDIKYMSFDRPNTLTGHVETTTGTDQIRTVAGYAGTLDGSGIGIAILDSGIAPNHHSFLATNSATESGAPSRIIASVDFTGEGRTDDPYGHGTHCASIAAGNAHVDQGGYTGIARNADIVNVRVLDSNGSGSSSAVIAGVDWCITNKATYNIRVMSMSLGAPAVDSYVNDPVCQAVGRAVSAGIVVVAAAGNSGKDAYGNKLFGAIHSPGCSPAVITVGAANTFGTDRRDDDSVTSYSSRGPTRGSYTDGAGVQHFDNLIKPDLIAPGNKIIDAASPGNYLLTNNPNLNADQTPAATGHTTMYMSGTSMATPVVAGAAALILQMNPSLSPNLVKAVLEYTAQPLSGFTTVEQGAGEVNVEGAVRLAAAIRQDLNGRVVGDPLILGVLPAQTTTIGGVSFPWGGGLIQKWNAISGLNLIQQYNGIYGSGALLTDGVLFSGGSLLQNLSLLSPGTSMTGGILMSDGTLLANGTVLTDGTLLGDGTILSDGTVLSDGVLLSDGSLLSDSVLLTDSTAAESILSGGDPGNGMSPGSAHH
ncbi:MAG TPA: S8 family peptidase [Blastocatellia bacterium]|nr:S8 family peptidase [Blastocatellia bacterium]